jgi:hypothetical protein
MLDEADLDAAVAEGLLTQDSANALRAFAARRSGGPAPAETQDDEHFRFLRGFNDFFFAIGVLFLGIGVFYFAGNRVVPNLFGAIIFWALAELLLRRMRLVLPGIVLACFFALFVFLVLPADLPFFPPAPYQTAARPLNTLNTFGSRGLFQTVAPVAIAAKSLVSCAALVLFYLRFRLPFTLMLVAGTLVFAVLTLAGPYGQDAQFYSFLLLACGLAVFGAAMAFDLSDRERKTRRGDCAFWLHLLAAPLIVHSLIRFVALDVSNVTTKVSAAIVAIVIALTLIAVIVDRRALLVSALSYIGVIIATAVRSAAETDNTTAFFMTLVILGALGVGWLPLRRWFIARLPSDLADRLPVVPA